MIGNIIFGLVQPNRQPRSFVAGCVEVGLVRFYSLKTDENHSWRMEWFTASRNFFGGGGFSSRLDSRG